MDNANKLITAKVFISGNTESYNIELNKQEKLKNLKSFIAAGLNQDPLKIYINYKNINIEESNFNENDSIMNILGNNKMPYFKVYFKNEQSNQKAESARNDLIKSDSTEFLERHCRKSTKNERKLNKAYKSSDKNLNNSAADFKKTAFLNDSGIYSSNYISAASASKKDFYSKGSKEAAGNQSLLALDEKDSNNININSSYISGGKSFFPSNDKEQLRKSKYSQSSNKTTTKSYIMQKELHNLKKEIFELKKDPINLSKCVYLDAEKIKEYSDIENQILYVELTINSLCNNLVKLKENLISNLVIRKDFFDTEKKSNEKLLHLLSKKSNAFNSELDNLLKKANADFNLNFSTNNNNNNFNNNFNFNNHSNSQEPEKSIYNSSNIINKISTSNSITNIKELFNEENAGTKFYKLFNTIYELKIEKTNISKSMEKLNTNLLKLNYSQTLILNNLQKNLENFLSVAAKDKDSFSTLRHVYQAQNKLVCDELEKNVFSNYNNIYNKNYLNLNFENLTKLNNLTQHLKFNKEIAFAQSDLSVKLNKSITNANLNLSNSNNFINNKTNVNNNSNHIYKNNNCNNHYEDPKFNFDFCFSFKENSDQIFAFNIQTSKKFALKALIPKAAEGGSSSSNNNNNNNNKNKLLHGSKMIQIPNTNSAFITGGIENPITANNNPVYFGNVVASRKCFFFSFDSNSAINCENYASLVEFLKEKISEEAQSAEKDRIQTMFDNYCVNNALNDNYNKFNKSNSNNSSSFINCNYINNNNNNLFNSNRSVNSKSQIENNDIIIINNKNNKNTNYNDFNNNYNNNIKNYKNNNNSILNNRSNQPNSFSSKSLLINKNKNKISNKKINENLQLQIQEISNESNTNTNTNTNCSFSGVYCNNNKSKKAYFNVELTEIPNMSFARWRHSSIVISNRFLICVSGFENKKCEFFDFSNSNNSSSCKIWKNLPDLNIPRMDANLFYLNESYLFCFGGVSTSINTHNNNNNTNNNSFYVSNSYNNNNINNGNNFLKSKKLNFYNVKKIERLKLTQVTLEKHLFFEKKQWEFLNLFDNYGESGAAKQLLISQMGILKVNENNLLLLGGDQNFSFANENIFVNLNFSNRSNDNNNQSEEKNLSLNNNFKNKNNKNLSLENFENNNFDDSIRLVSIDENGNFEFKLLDCKLSRNAKFDFNSQFLEFKQDENLKRFYCYDSNNEICKIDLKV